MPIRDTGTGFETIREGKWVPLEPESSSVGINGQRLYTYDKNTGVLKLNTSMVPGMLENITEGLEKSSDKKLNVTLSIPPIGKQQLQEVRSVQALTLEEIKMPEKETDYSKTYHPETRSFLQRVKDYFTREDSLPIEIL